MSGYHERNEASERAADTLDELRADKAVILERVTAACELLLAKGDTEVFNVLTGNGAHVPKVRRDVLADNERLRGVIALGEHRDQHCDWCGAFRKPSAGDKEPHAADCPAFTPDGKVK